MKNKTPRTTDKIIKAINSLNITSDRLTIKKFSDAEIPFNITHESDPEIMKYIRDPCPIEITREKTQKCAEDWTGEESEWTLFGLRLKSTGDYIGMLCFRYESMENDTVEMGWRLGPEAMGKGYATEAAKRLLDLIKTEIKPHKVVAYCVVENSASVNVMLKLGMQKEAHLRQYSKLGGQWFDEAIYGLILN
jgi:RimJ/RimL family protein N-acetyltransferase